LDVRPAGGSDVMSNEGARLAFQGPLHRLAACSAERHFQSQDLSLVPAYKCWTLSFSLTPNQSIPTFREGVVSGHTHDFPSARLDEDAVTPISVCETTGEHDNVHEDHHRSYCRSRPDYIARVGRGCATRLPLAPSRPTVHRCRTELVRNPGRSRQRYAPPLTSLEAAFRRDRPPSVSRSKGPSADRRFQCGANSFATV